jgi:hypothetical protein
MPNPDDALLGHRRIGEWTFPLQPTFTIGLPAEARFLKAGMHSGSPCVWAWVDTTAPIRDYPFWLFYNNEPIDRDTQHKTHYIDTFPDDTGVIRHLFVTKRAVPYRFGISALFNPRIRKRQTS